MIEYLKLVRSVLELGDDRNDRTGVGTLSLFGEQFRHDMRDGFPLLTNKFTPLRVVFEELRWFLSGSTDRKDLQKHRVKIWDKWIAPNPQFDGDMGPIYGAQWRDFGGQGVDQIASLLESIKHEPNSRRLMVSAWCPQDIQHMALPPCHYGFQVKCYDNKTMSLHMTMRSADIFLGVPFNIASYAMLLEMICHVTGYQARELIVSFGDLHLYKNHVKAAELMLSRTSRPLPTVKIDEAFVSSRMSPLNRLLNMTWENVVFDDYDCWPSIKAEVAV